MPLQPLLGSCLGSDPPSPCLGTCGAPPATQLPLSPPTLGLRPLIACRDAGRPPGTAQMAGQREVGRGRWILLGQRSLTWGLPSSVNHRRLSDVAMLGCLAYSRLQEDLVAGSTGPIKQQHVRINLLMMVRSLPSGQSCVP